MDKYPDDYKTTLAQANALVKERQLKAAALEYEKAGAILAVMTDISPNELAMFYSKLGKVYTAIALPLQAIGCFQKIVAMYEVFSPAKQLPLAMAYMHIAKIYDTQGNGSKALDYFVKAAEAAPEAPITTEWDIADIYNRIAILYTNEEDYHTALDYYQKALAELLEHTPLSYPNLEIILSNMKNTLFEARNILPAAQISDYQEWISLRFGKIV